MRCHRRFWSNSVWHLKRVAFNQFKINIKSWSVKIPIVNHRLRQLDLFQFWVFLMLREKWGFGNKGKESLMIIRQQTSCINNSAL